MPGSESDEEKLVGPRRARGPVRFFSGRAAVGLGATQIVFGCLAIIAQIIILAVYDVFFNAVSQGIWCGGAFIVCGIVGVIAGKRRTFPWIVANLVLCVIICLFAAAIIALSALTSVYNYGAPYIYVPCESTGHWGQYSGYYVSSGAQSGAHRHVSNLYWNNYYYGSNGAPCTGAGWIINIPWVAQFSMNLLMGCLGILSAILATVSATLSCAPLCCNPEEQPDIKPSKERAEPVEACAEALPEKTPIEDHIFLDVPTNAYHI